VERVGRPVPLRVSVSKACLLAFDMRAKLGRTGSGFVCAIGWAVAISCVDRDRSERAEARSSCEDSRVRQVVEGLGENLKRVSRLAPDSVVAREIRQAYAPYITADLLEKWTSDPKSAPGRDVSSPWPDRLEVRSVHAAGPETCHVEADVVYESSATPTQGTAPPRAPVTLVVRKDEDWRVSAYDAGPRPTDSTSASAAADVLGRYYASINARDFGRAYALWGDEGAASKQTPAEFAAGFAQTARSQIEIGEPGRIEGAAGSRYMMVPVVVRAVTKRGEEQRFSGTYTLRRSVVEGASPQAQRWHIYAADLARLR
jgi:hypothetical protein